MPQSTHGYVSPALYPLEQGGFYEDQAYRSCFANCHVWHVPGSRMRGANIVGVPEIRRTTSLMFTQGLRNTFITVVVGVLCFSVRPAVLISGCQDKRRRIAFVRGFATRQLEEPFGNEWEDSAYCSGQEVGTGPSYNPDSCLNRPVCNFQLFGASWALV